MTVFQVLLLVLVGCLLLGTVAGVLKGSVAWRAGVGWVCLWILAAIAIVWPGATALAAGALGIGRGTDLVLYCAVVVMMLGFLTTYVRLRRVRRDITLLVRQLAIRDAIVMSSATDSSEDTE